MTTNCTITVNREALEQAFALAAARHTDTTCGWGKAIANAYTWLMQCAQRNQSLTVVDGDLLVPSARGAGRTYRAGKGCTCAAGDAARRWHTTCVCWHRAARQLVCRMLELQPPPVNDAVRQNRSAEALAQVLELYA